MGTPSEIEPDSARNYAKAGSPDDSPGQYATVEDALARALERASAAAQWDVVAALAAELQARRLEASRGAR